ncbi:MAG: tetratricopeptide repeat protein [Ardenticatenales bacterium]|nr:tetratricopeptide repeat protein [Ardenticatenales bacterium]
MTRTRASGNKPARPPADSSLPPGERTFEIGGRTGVGIALLIALTVCGTIAWWLVRSGAGARMQAQLMEWPVPAPEPAQAAAMEPDVQAAITAARAAVEANRGSGDAWRRLGMVYDAHSLWPLAAPSYARALSLMPNDGRTAYYYAVATELADAPIDDVAAAFARVIELAPAYGPAHLRLGDALMRVGRNIEARDALIRAVDVYPPASSARARRSLGLVLLALGDAEGAVASLQAAIRIRADDSSTWKGLAQALNQLGRGQEARQAVERAARLSDTLPYFDDWRLTMLEEAVSRSLVEKRIIGKVQMGKPDDALADALRWEVRHPDWPSIKRMIGNLHRSAGREDLARPYFEAATALTEQGKTQ